MTTLDDESEIKAQGKACGAGSAMYYRNAGRSLPELGSRWLASFSEAHTRHLSEGIDALIRSLGHDSLSEVDFEFANRIATVFGTIEVV